MRGMNMKMLCSIGLLTAWSLMGCSPQMPLNEPPPLSEQPPAKVSLSPAAGAISPGDTFTRTVEVQDLGNTFYVSLDVTYDPAVIEFLDAAEGTFLNRNGSEATAFQVALQNLESGKITIGLTRLGVIGEASGTGTLLTLSFQALAPGTTSLTFANPKGFKNSGNQDVTVDAWEDGAVTVQ